MRRSQILFSKVSHSESRDSSNKRGKRAITSHKHIKVQGSGEERVGTAGGVG